MPEPDTKDESIEEAPPETQASKKVPRNRILCRITCLDKNFLTAELPKSAKGLDLMRRVFDQLNIEEREYFGLLFIRKKEKYWLEPRKEIKSQLKGSKPEFQVGIKFYEPYPSKLKADYSRYMLCLQVRDDINCERLPCSFGSQALLGSYIVQGELGDYDPREHQGNYLEGMVFGPKQTEELVDKIKELHKVNKGMTPAQCDTQYLEAARKLTMYGVDAHPATDGNNDEILIGVSWAGVLIFKDDLRQNRFPWQKVIELLYKGKDFSVKSKPGELAQLITTMTFKMPSEKAAKRLYKSCVEHHTFFRLSFPDPPPSKADTLLKKGSKFRYSDRTLYQIRKEGIPVAQEEPKFARVSSKNWSERYEPATTEIIVVADEERKKRPHDKDRRGNGPNDKKQKGDRVAPLSEEEMMATMTPDERDEYKRKMAERLGKITTTTTTTTTTVYYPGQEGQEGEDGPIKAQGAGVLESEQVAYGVGERDPDHVRIIALKAEEEERKKKEEEERERKRKEEEERERELEKERERQRKEEEEREREREKRRKELERLAAADRADIAARKPPTETILYKTTTVDPKKDEAELLEFSFATPVASGDTIKRAKMKTAETDSYKGRVMRVEDNGYPESEHKPAPAIAPKPKREEPYARGHSTLPPRTQPIHTLDDGDDDDRRKSADDMDHRDGDRRSRGVQLITKEELVRCYSPAGSQEAKPEPKRPSQKERESDQVAKNIKRYSYERELEDHPEPTEVKTEKVLIGPGGETHVYHQRVPPEVHTQSYTINSVGGPVKDPVTERTIVSQSTAGDVQAAPGDQEGGVIVTRTVTIDGNRQPEPIETHTIRHTTVPTEIITKTITIEGDGGPLTAQELKEIMAQQGANIDSEVITTTYTTTSREQRVEKTVSEKMSLVDEDGNVIATGDADTDRAIAEAIRQAKEADPNVKVTEVMITRGDETVS